MTLVLSIIAEQPRGQAVPGVGNPDGNAAIESIVATMAKAMSLKGDYDKEIARATYVHDIALILRNLKDAGRTPDIIQIIGHGSAGRLELGSFWTGEPFDKLLGYAILDSNPSSYGMLADLIPASSRVFLLGCSVGASSPGGYVASGRALLFDLEDMSGANIYAADGLVHPALFEDGFLYRGPLVTSGGRPANPAALPASISERTILSEGGDDEVPRLRELISAPANGSWSGFDVDKDSIAKSFSHYVLARPQPKQLLAMAEFVFTAENYDRVEAICCLRYLRAQTKDGRTVYFEKPASNAWEDISFGQTSMSALRERYSRQ